jgi:hypothetical protein
MINKILAGLLALAMSQITLAQGESGSSNSQAGSVYILEAGVVKRNPLCALVDPSLVYQRLSHISDTNYICYTDGVEYFQHIARAGDGSVEIEIGYEDNFDGTWYGYVFEYKPGTDGALPDGIYRYDLSNEEVQQCRDAFEPPFDCSTPM